MKSNSKWLVLIFVVGAIAIATGLSCSVIPEKHAMLSRDQAIELAGKEATRLGYDVTNMQITVSRHSEPWNEYFPKESRSMYCKERKKYLEEKEYWAVYYGSRKKGGDCCIFVDVATGKILTTYRGK